MFRTTTHVVNQTHEHPVCFLPLLVYSTYAGFTSRPHYESSAATRNQLRKITYKQSCPARYHTQVRKMYQLDANNFIMILYLINGLYMFRTFTCPSSGVLICRLFHCRMWCYAIGVEAVVLRSWRVVLCTVCKLVSN